MFAYIEQDSFLHRRIIVMILVKYDLFKLNFASIK